MTAALAHLVLTGASTSSKSSSSSFDTLLPFLVIGGAFYFLFFRPQQRKAKALREQTKVFEVGDEVLTAGGLVGHVIDIDGERVTLETSVGASFVVLKQYVLRKLDEPVPDSDESDLTEDPDEDHELGTGDTDHEPDTDSVEVGEGDETEHSDDHVTETSPERTTEPTTNGAGTLEDATTDMWGTPRENVDAEEPSEGGGPANPRRSRRSGGRKRRPAGGTAAGPSGPDGPSSI
jgi:preprotein translocase subunit YajC